MVSAARLLDPAPIRTARPSVRRVAGTVVTAHGLGALIGAATWVLAARSLPAATVGVGVALTGVLGWCGLVANGGLGSAVVDRAPGLPAAEVAALVRTAAGRAALLGAGAGLLAAVVLGAVDGLVPGADRPPVAAALVVGAAATSAAIVGDAAAVATGRAGLVVGRSLVFAGLRLALLGAGLATGVDGRDLLVGGWALATAVAAAGQLALVARGPAARSRRRPAFGASAWANHLVSLAAQSPALLLPAVLAAVARPADAGAFGAAWQVASVAALASPAMATAVFADGRHDPAGVGTAARRAGRDLLLVLLPVTALVVLAGPWALDLLGPGYRERGAVALALVVVALLPDAVSNVAVGAWRARRRYRPAVALNGAMAVVALGGAMVLGREHGATGAGVAWLLAQGLGAAVVLAVVLRPGREAG